jgi:hypothetical protein
MKKITTIFKRDWSNGAKITKELAVNFSFDEAIATEKLDGTNVRLTIRNHTLVRLEKRRNPDLIQKRKGIEEPWYIDADESDPADKYIWDAARNVDLSSIEDGEYSGEAIGPKIQGNPLNLEKHIVVLFTIGQAPVFDNVPYTYDELKQWLPLQQSRYGKGKIEGIVWHHPSGEMVKIKTKDFN